MTYTISNTSQEVVVDADADYAIPAALCDEVGRRVTVRASVQLVLTSAVGTINGEASHTLYPEESFQMIFTGANWIIV